MDMKDVEKKHYSSPELKEWGSIADITLGYGNKTEDVSAPTYSSIAL